jgi:hypothetical protein
LRRNVFPVAALAAVVVTTGCSGTVSSQQDAAAGAAVRFEADAGAAPGAACAALTPAAREDLARGGSCVQGLVAARLPSSPDERQGAGRVEVYGDHAMVGLGADTVFLVRAGNRWLVTAAGCTSRGADRPYDCRVDGS